MNKLIEIKNKIHIVNPDVTDELLDLLYEYILVRLKKQHSIENMSTQIKSDEDFKKLISLLIFNK